MATPPQTLPDDTRGAALQRSYRHWASFAGVRFFGRWALRLLMLGLLMVVLEFAVDGEWLFFKDTVLPRPFGFTGDRGGVIDELDFLIFGDFFWQHWVSTVKNTMIGFAIGAAIGLSLAISIVLYPISKPFVSDSVVGFEALPKILLIPVLFTWFGFGGASIIILTAMITFFPVFVSSLTGMINVPEDDRRLLASYQAGRVQRLYMSNIPRSFPNIFGGLKIGIANSMIGTILAEFIFGNEGLGFLVDLFHNRVLLEREWAGMVAVAVTFALLFWGLEMLQRYVAFWEKTPDEIIQGA